VGREGLDVEEAGQDEDRKDGEEKNDEHELDEGHSGRLLDGRHALIPREGRCSVCQASVLPDG
jgi:hypothetical protein